MLHLESDLVRWHILLLFVVICGHQTIQAQTPTVLSDTLIDYHPDQIVQLIPSDDPTRGMGYASIGFDRFASNRSFFLGHWKNDADLLSWEQGEYWLDDFPFAGWKYQNEYVMIGYRSLDSTSWQRNFKMPAVLTSMRIDTNDQQVWEDTVSDYWAEFDRAIPLRDSSWLAVGRYQLARYKADGELMWRKTYFYPGTLFQRFYGAVLLDDKIAVISKRLASRNPDTFSSGVLFISHEGDSLAFSEKANYLYCDDLFEIGGNLGATGTTLKISWDSSTSKLDTVSGFGISYLSFSGDSLSTNIFNIHLDDSIIFLRSITKQLHDKSLLVGGTFLYQNGTRVPLPEEPAYMIFRYDTQKDSMLWSVTLPANNSSGLSFKDIAYNSNNEIYAVLRTNDFLSQTIRLARLSADQALPPVSVAALPDLQVTAWPNPAKDKLWFHSEAQVRLSIKDISGRCIYEDKVQGKTLIHLEQPSPGIYFWIARDPTGNTAHGKIAIQR